MKNEKKLNEKKLLETLRDKFLHDINQFLKHNKETHIIIPLSSLIGTSVVLLSMADRDNKFSTEIENYIKISLNEGVHLMEKILKESRKIN